MYRTDQASKQATACESRLAVRPHADTALYRAASKQASSRAGPAAVYRTASKQASKLACRAGAVPDRSSKQASKRAAWGRGGAVPDSKQASKQAGVPTWRGTGQIKQASKQVCRVGQRRRCTGQQARKQASGGGPTAVYRTASKQASKRAGCWVSSSVPARTDHASKQAPVCGVAAAQGSRVPGESSEIKLACLQSSYKIKAMLMARQHESARLSTSLQALQRPGCSLARAQCSLFHSCCAAPNTRSARRLSARGAESRKHAPCRARR